MNALDRTGESDLVHILRIESDGNLREYARELSISPHAIVNQNDLRRSADLIDKAVERICALEDKLRTTEVIAKGLLAGDGSPTEADWKPIETLPKDRRYVEIRQRYVATSDGKDTILRPTHWRVAKP